MRSAPKVREKRRSALAAELSCECRPFHEQWLHREGVAKIEEDILDHFRQAVLKIELLGDAVAYQSGMAISGPPVLHTQ